MSQLKRVPDFFIVGAPKCGTTALYSYLETHPDIFMSPVKEPHYFYRDFRTSTSPDGRVGGFARPEYYSKLFAKASKSQLCGEGSTLYLFSRFAVAEILRANPDAKLVAMVRNPLEMVVSFHRQKVYDLQENELDLAVAWDLSEARSRGCSVAPDCKAPEELNYKSVGRLGEQIARLLSTADAEQVHIVVFDDFVLDPSAAYRGVLRFLGLPDPGRTEFAVVNAHKEHRLPWISKLMVHTPAPLAPVKSFLKGRFPAQVKYAAKSINRINSRSAPKPGVAAELQGRIAKEFSDDIDLLSNLLKRDLSHWYKCAL